MAASLDQALYLAARGFYVGPLIANGKIPPQGTEWQKVSTVDFDVIKTMFHDPYMGWGQVINLMCDPYKSGFCVIDLDNKNGKNGSVEWKRLLAGRECRTFTVRTPSGGFHLYFKATGYTNSAGAIAPGIDVRCKGGYVVAPGSTVNGVAYEIIDDIEPVHMPDFIHEILSAHRIASISQDKNHIISEDDADDVAWAIDFLKSHEPAIEGCGGDSHTYKMFCVLKEHGISESTALDLADAHWNDRCLPPWGFDDLIKKAENAYKSAHNPQGIKSANAEFTAPNLPAHTGLPFRIANPVVCLDPATIPYRPWEYGSMMLRRNLTLIGSAPGTGKSLLVLVVALSKATGRNLIDVDPCGRGRVLIYNNEDEMEEMNRRLAGLMQYYKVTWDDLWDHDAQGNRTKSYLYMSSGQDNPFRIAQRAAKTNKLTPFHADAMVAELKAENISMVFIDPLAETHPGKENENDEMGSVGQMYRAVAHRANCAIGLVHHTRKHDNASSEGHSGNLDSFRGASSLGGVVRIALTFFTMSKKEARKYGVKESDAWQYVLLEQAKANMAPGNVNRMWFKKESIVFNATVANPDGESVGVLRRVYLTEGQDVINQDICTLLQDIEALTLTSPMTIPAITRELIAAFPFHQGKMPRTLEAAIRRLFGEEGVCASVNGVLSLEDTASGNRVIKVIRFEPNERVISMSQML